MAVAVQPPHAPAAVALTVVTAARTKTTAVKVSTVAVVPVFAHAVVPAVLPAAPSVLEARMVWLSNEPVEELTLPLVTSV